jgi:hypothetical protein
MSFLSSGRWVVVMVFNTNKTDLHVIIKILLKVVLNTIKLNLTLYIYWRLYFLGIYGLCFFIIKTLIGIMGLTPVTYSKPFAIFQVKYSKMLWSRFTIIVILELIIGLTGRKRRVSINFRSFWINGWLTVRSNQCIFAYNNIYISTFILSSFH